MKKKRKYSQFLIICVNGGSTDNPIWCAKITWWLITLKYFKNYMTF